VEIVVIGLAVVLGAATYAFYRMAESLREPE
jgi:hypothetical protein